MSGRGVRMAGLLAGVLLLGTPACSAPESAGGEAEAPLAPAFSLEDLDGNPVSLAQFRGKTVVIDFWATWCPPCVFQVPELNVLHRAHREAGDLVVLGVSVDVDGASVVRPWAEEHDIQYTVLLGDEALAREFGAVGFPTLVVVTPDGRIDSLHVGLIEAAELEGIVGEVAARAAPGTT